jgi:putative inorganic carbon (HCO3(-)) transporter
MSSNHRFRGSLRSFIALPLNFAVTAYVIALSFSLGGMEVAGWASCILLILFYFADRMNSTGDLEFHTLGAEIPIVGFFIVVIVGFNVKAPAADFFATLDSLRNFILLFVFTYALQIIKNLNRLILTLIIFMTLVAGYSVATHLFGGGLSLPFSLGDYPLINHSFLMALCFPWSAILLSRRTSWWLILLYIFSLGILLTGLLLSNGRGAWIACLVTLPVMAVYASRKFFVGSVITLFICAGLLYNFNASFREQVQSVFTENYSNEDRKNIWHINMEMFRDHPWIGVGYKQNQVLCQGYYDKESIKNSPCTDAHSNYVEILATTGLFGFVTYMAFVLAYLLMTVRLFTMIPGTHYWHKVFALGALGAQVAFQVGGLTQWNFGNPETQHLYFFILAIVGYMGQRYFLHIVSDDRSI